MRHSHQSRRHVLATAALLLPLPALATSYNLTNQSVNLATAPYTAADTLNTSGVTFTSSLSAATLPAAINLLSTTTVNSPNNITFTSSLSGSGSLKKIGTGTLTLAAPSPSFTGPATISAGTLFLEDPAALGPSSAFPISLAGSTLDVTGSLPLRPFTGGTLANNSTTPVTIGPSLSMPSNPGITFGGTGDITFTTPLSSINGLTKSGTGTLTYSTASNISEIEVDAGTFRIGIASAFSGSPYISLLNGAIFDLNGFNFPTNSASLSLNSNTLVNNNPSVTSTLSVFPGSFPTLGGTGDINLTAKAASLTKIGSGTLTLSATNPNFSGSLTLNDGTLRLNASNAVGTSASTAIHLNYNSTTQLGGALDLNGYPAPSATYYLSGGILENNNTSTPSHIDFSNLHLGSGSNEYLTFDGTGDLDITGYLPAPLSKLGSGTLILNTPQSLNGNVDNGSIRLASPGFSGYSSFSALTLYGSNIGSYFNNYGPGGLLDIYGNTGGFPSLTLYNNTGIVNNAVGTTSTFSGQVIIDTTNQPHNLTFGGDGNLVIPPNSGIYFPTTITLNKVGAGLLTLPISFNPKGVNLRAGTLQAESNAQLGSSISFLGGTLRIAPLYLAPANSYTFSQSISVDPSSGGTLDTQRNSLFTGFLTGSGPFTKTGAADATLNLAPSSRLALTLQAGTLHLSSTSTPAITALSLTGGSLDLSTAGLVLDYTGASPLNTVVQALASDQIYASAANADPAHDSAIACVEASSFLSLTGSQTATWSGQLVDATSLLFKYTLAGDANLDGRIDADDYALLDRGFSRHAADWLDGDFNYDGQVTSADYLLIDGSYLQSHAASPAFLAMRESQFGEAYVAQLLTSVPEPFAAWVFAGVLLWLPSRRHQRSKA